MLERFEDAQRYYAQILSAWPEHELRPAAEYWLGMAFLFDTKYEEGYPHFDAVVQNHPGSMYVEDAMFRRAVCAYGASRFDDSERLLEEFTQKYPSSTLSGEATMMRGDIAGALGYTDEAVAFYRQAMQSDNLNIEHYNHCAFQAGQILTDAEKWSDAETHFLGYISRCREGSNIPLATYWVGKCILALRGEEAALDYYRQSMLTLGRDRAAIGVDMILDEWIGLTRKMDPDRVKAAWNGLQQSLRNANDKQDRTTALRLYRMLLHMPSLTPDDREKLLARLLDPAVLDDASPAVLTFILDTAKERGQHDLAKLAAEKLIADFPETDYALDARMALADYAIQATKAFAHGSEAEREALSTAIRHLDVIRAVYATQPEAGQALMLLGGLYTERGDFKKADEAYADVLGVKEWRPMWAEALYGRGFCAMQDRQYMKACAYFERIYLMYSGYRTWAAKAYLRRAECLSRLGDGGKARETLEAMVADPACEGLPELAEAQAMLQKL
jgi:TolA-binding protein